MRPNLRDEMIHSFATPKAYDRDTSFYAKTPKSSKSINDTSFRMPSAKKKKSLPPQRT
jgi:hypothetical protein